MPELSSMISEGIYHAHHRVLLTPVAAVPAASAGSIKKMTGIPGDYYAQLQLEAMAR